VTKVAGTLMLPADTTVTLVVASAMFVPLAWITAEPGDTLVTGTSTVVAFAAKVTVDGTLATPGLLEFKAMVRPPDGAAAERFSTAFTVAAPVIVMLGCAKLTVAVTRTAWVAAV
jgi:hypothetical protein